MTEEVNATSDAETEIIPAETEEVTSAEQEPTDGQEAVTDTESDAASEKATEPDKPSPEQRKIARLAHKERENRREIARLTRALDDRPAPVTDQPKEPKIDDYDTIDEYVDAKIKFHTAKPEPTEVKGEDTPRADQYVQDSMNELFDTGADKYEDFEELVRSPDLKMTTIMADALFELDSEVQADIAYHLAKNPKEAARISRLSPMRQVGEIAKLEDKDFSTATPTKRPSDAPKPIKPVGGAKTPSSEIKPVEDFESFMKKRNKQLGRV